MIALLLLLGCPKPGPLAEIEAIESVSVAVTGWEVVPGEPPSLAVECALEVKGKEPVDHVVLEVHVTQVDADVTAYAGVEGRLPPGGPVTRRVKVPIAAAEVQLVEASPFKAAFARQ